MLPLQTFSTFLLSFISSSICHAFLLQYSFECCGVSLVVSLCVGIRMAVFIYLCVCVSYWFVFIFHLSMPLSICFVSFSPLPPAVPLRWLETSLITHRKRARSERALFALDLDGWLYGRMDGWIDGADGRENAVGKVGWTENLSIQYCISYLLHN